MNNQWSIVFSRLFSRRGAFLLVLLVGLIAFEIFNYASTKLAFESLFGGIKMGAFLWSDLLTAAFCCIDVAGLARLFTPQIGRDEPAEVWYLFGAWILGAAMNATLTWWGVSLAIAENGIRLNAASGLDPAFLLKVFPVFIAILVWVIRILLIGAFTTIGDRVLHERPTRSQSSYQQPRQIPSSPAQPVFPAQQQRPQTPTASQPYHGQSQRPVQSVRPPVEPTYIRNTQENKR